MQSGLDLSWSSVQICLFGNVPAESVASDQTTNQTTQDNVTVDTSVDFSDMTAPEILAYLNDTIEDMNNITSLMDSMNAG